MSKDGQEEIRRIACPAALRAPLEVFRVAHGDEERYRVADPALGTEFIFEPWQFFVLEILPACADFAHLDAAFVARYGKPLASADVNDLLAQVAKRGLLSAAAMEYPLVAALQSERVAEARDSGSAAPGKEASATQTAPASEEPLPPGVCEVTGLDDSLGHRTWKLFDPKQPLKLLHPVLQNLRYAIYLLPLILLGSLYVISSSAQPLAEDLGHPGLLKYLAFCMPLVNIIVTSTTALVAYSFRAAVKGFCLVFHFGVLPCFMAEIGGARGFSRRERIWLHAAPLLVRIGLFGVGILLWSSTRTVGGVWASFGLALAVISAISFFIAANPLIKSSVYHLISAYSDEPDMRRRSRAALVGRLRGGVYTKIDNDILAAYSLATATYLVVLAGIVLLLGRAFGLHLGASIFLLLAIVGVPLAWRMIGKFKELGRSQARQEQFKRWRKAGLPKGESESDKSKRPNALAAYWRRAFGLLILVVLFLPYHHEIGGRFLVLPQEKQDLTAEISGLIASVDFDGGEFLRQGTVIGRLSCTDYEAQVRILTARIAEQEAVIAELKSRPRPEEVALAESNLRTEETRAVFSGEKLDRMEKLYAENTVSFEDLEDVRREHELDIKRVAERRANLDLIKAGAAPDEIDAAEAKLRSWQEERQLYLEKIEKSVFYMPFDGTLATTQLKQKIGSYLQTGQPLAMVENTQQVIVQIDVAEEDIGFVRGNARVRVRLPAYSDEDFEGTSLVIGPTVTEGRSGRALQITARIDNRDGRLKSGMQGYAKVSTEALPVWKVLSLGIIRFFNIEAWSWLP